MIDFNVLTLFPDMIMQGLMHSIILRAVNSGIVRINCIDIRDFSNDRHRHVDDSPYGGGAGMVMKAQPIYDAWKSIHNKSKRVIYMTPQGKVFNQNIAKELSLEQSLTILCGHYEGVDERVIDEIVTDRISIGDFVLTGGELAAMVLIDAVSRIIPGVLGKTESFEDESFSNGLLEYPQYTKPSVFMGKQVPDVLLSGHHANIQRWRHEQSLIRTYRYRKELLDRAQLSQSDIEFIEKFDL